MFFTCAAACIHSRLYAANRLFRTWLPISPSRPSSPLSQTLHDDSQSVFFGNTEQHKVWLMCEQVMYDCCNTHNKQGHKKHGQKYCLPLYMTSLATRPPRSNKGRTAGNRVVQIILRIEIASRHEKHASRNTAQHGVGIDAPRSIFQLIGSTRYGIA